MTLSGLRSLDKSAIVGLLFVVSGKRDPQGRKLLVGFEPTKAFLGFVHGRSGPAQSHRRRTPALHIAGDATHGPHHIFDDVGAGQRAPQFRRKYEDASSPRRTDADIWRPVRDRLLAIGELVQYRLGFAGGTFEVGFLAVELQPLLE